MHHAEAVRDEGRGRPAGGVHELDQGLGQRGALGLVLAGFARVEADVLQQQHIAVGEALGAGERVGAHHVAGELHMAPEPLAELLGHRGQRELRVRLPLGAAEVSGHHHLGSGLDQRPQRGQRGDDPARVGDTAVVVQGDIQIGAYEHAPTRNTLRQKIIECLDAHRSGPTRATCRPAR